MNHRRPQHDPARSRAPATGAALAPLPASYPPPQQGPPVAWSHQDPYDTATRSRTGQGYATASHLVQPAPEYASAPSDHYSHALAVTRQVQHCLPEGVIATIPHDAASYGNVGAFSARESAVSAGYPTRPTGPPMPLNTPTASATVPYAPHPDPPSGVVDSALEGSGGWQAATHQAIGESRQQALAYQQAPVDGYGLGRASGHSFHDWAYQEAGPSSSRAPYQDSALPTPRPRESPNPTIPTASGPPPQPRTH